MLLHAHVHNIHACRQLAVVIQICVDCTAINNQVNNFHSLPSGPYMQWGEGEGVGVGVGAIAPPLATGRLIT